VRKPELQGDPKKQKPPILSTFFDFNYSSFVFQVAVVDLVHEILLQ